MIATTSMKLTKNLALQRGLFLLCIVICAACGEGSDDSDAVLGDEQSLHPNIESLARLHFKYRDQGVRKADADVLQQPLVSGRNSAVEGLSELGRSSDSVLSQFIYYPDHSISSRGIAKHPTSDINECLSECVANSRCGSVSFNSTSRTCILNGPAQDSDRLVQFTAASRAWGAVPIDTYVLESRSQHGSPTLAHFLWNVTRPDASYSDFLYVHFMILYADGTASEWFDSHPTSDQSRGIQPYGLGAAPDKPIEALLVSMGDDNPIHVEFLQFRRVNCPFDDTGCLEDASFDKYVYALFGSEILTPQTFTLDMSCSTGEAGILSGCSRMIALEALNVNGATTGLTPNSTLLDWSRKYEW